MVVRSIANIYDWGTIFTKAWSAEVGYRGCGLTYRATYNILYGESATGELFWVRKLKNFRNDAIFCSSLFHLYGTPA